MDSSFLIDLLKMIVFLPLIIFLIYAVFKFGGKYFKNISNGKIIKVYERVPLSQNVFLSVVSVLDKVYLISNTNSEVKILLELDRDALDKYKEQDFTVDINKINFLKRKNKDE